MDHVSYAALGLLGICLLAGCGKSEKSSGNEPVSVEVKKMELQPVYGERVYSGTVEEESGTSLSFLAAGTLSHLYVAEGQMVRKGALLASIDETSLRNAYDMAAATRMQAEDAYGRMKQLHESGSLPDIQWIEVQSKLKQAVAAEQIARKSLSDGKLHAPFAGFVAAKMAEAGQNVMPGMPVLKLVKIDRVKVKIAVPENEIAGIRKGDTLQVEVPALEGKAFKGIVAEKGVTAHPLSRSYEVKVEVKNPAHELLPGMVSSVFPLSGNNGRKAFVLPVQAVMLNNDNRTFVWVNQKGKASKRFIRSGSQTAQGLVVDGGLQEGDEVIIAGGQKVSEGMDVTTRN